MAKLRITYSKSAIGYSKDQKATVRSLGLGKLNSVAIHDDTPATRGMVFKVRHLVKVEEVADDTMVKAPKRTIRPVVSKQLADQAPAGASKPATRSSVTQELADEPPPRAARAATQKLADEPPAQSATPAATQELADEPAATAADDLEMIEGIGPKSAGVLHEAGISTFAALAATDAERLEEILRDASLHLASSETWAEQAKLAAAGDWEALKQLQESLKGGRRE
jgi:large subunit ribosomal protein L30